MKSNTLKSANGAASEQSEGRHLLPFPPPLADRKKKMETFDLESYDRYIVAFSGGKDSQACVLHLLDCGIPKSKIELWHHDVDGREGSAMMDWAVTRNYVRAFGKAFDIPVYFSWLEGGFEREMLRDNQRKAATKWENPDGTIGQAGGERGKLSTRRKFPQVCADLRVRWCSAYLKVDVMSAALCNQPRFNHSRTLVITGERAEESAARAKYKTFEPDRADRRGGRSGRLVDRWRPVHAWAEKEVWATLERYCVNPHPAYRVGFGRVSCQFCIFGNADQWASAKALSPERFEKIAEYESEFGCTLKRKGTLRELVEKGKIYEMAATDAAIAIRNNFDEPIILPEGSWTLPLGAYGDSCGPS
jgi:3'-phosphoadenosine 5'-phosphosulfate sulfotransferase (PAPS reductase)/FAD synthetase